MTERSGEVVERVRTKEVCIHGIKAVCLHCIKEYEIFHIETEFEGDLNIRVRAGFDKADVDWGGVVRKCQGHHKRLSSRYPFNHGQWELQRNGQKIGLVSVSSDALIGEVTLTKEEIDGYLASGLD